MLEDNWKMAKPCPTTTSIKNLPFLCTGDCYLVQNDLFYAMTLVLMFASFCSRIDWFCLKLSSNFKDKEMKTFVLGTSSIWTCRILNICFDFFMCTCLYKTTTNIQNSTRPNRSATKDIVFHRMFSRNNEF